MFGLTPRSARRAHHATSGHGTGVGTSHSTNTHRQHTSSTPRRGFFHRKDRDRVAGGYKASLVNPNTTHAGRQHAKHELHKRGHSAHVPFMTKVKRTLGIRSTPRAARTTHY